MEPSPPLNCWDNGLTMATGLTRKIPTGWTLWMFCLWLPWALLGEEGMISLVCLGRGLFLSSLPYRAGHCGWTDSGPSDRRKCGVCLCAQLGRFGLAPDFKLEVVCNGMGRRQESVRKSSSIHLHKQRGATGLHLPWIWAQQSLGNLEYIGFLYYSFPWLVQTGICFQNTWQWAVSKFNHK